MRKNYFLKLVKYMKNVYQIDHGLNKLSDGRVNPTYCTGQVILPVLLGFLLRIKSFNELNFMIKNHEFSKLFPRGKKLPQIDAIRDTLKDIDISGLNQMNDHSLKSPLKIRFLKTEQSTDIPWLQLMEQSFLGAIRKVVQHA
jgi:hypothetical protein